MNLLLLLAVAASANDWGSPRRTDAATGPAARTAQTAAASAPALPPPPPDTREPMIDRAEASRPKLQRTEDIFSLAKRGNQARGLSTAEIGVPDYKPMVLAPQPVANKARPAPAAPAPRARPRASARGTKTAEGVLSRSAVSVTPLSQLPADLLQRVHVSIRPDFLTSRVDHKLKGHYYDYGDETVAFVKLLDFDAQAPQPAVERWLVRLAGGAESVVEEPHPAPGKLLMAAFVLSSWDGGKVLGERHHYLMIERRFDQLLTTETYASPLVFDLDGDGVRMSRRSSAYDSGGALVKDAVHDISHADGLLVFDGDRDGLAGEGGLEAFGTATDLDGDRRPDGFPDGFLALKTLVSRAAALGAVSQAAAASGRLDAVALRALERLYGLGMKVGGVSGRVVSLEQAGVSEIRLPTASCRRQPNFDGQGNQVLRCAGAEFVRADGSVRAYEDVFFQL